MAKEIDLGSVVGPKGPKGDPGPAGAQGPKGATGAQGPAGADGKTPAFELRDGTLWAIYPD